LLIDELGHGSLYGGNVILNLLAVDVQVYPAGISCSQFLRVIAQIWNLKAGFERTGKIERDNNKKAPFGASV